MARPLFKMELKGAKELEKALLELPKRIGKNAIKRALVKVAGPIAEDAKSRAPVDSGKLKERIAVSATLSRRQRKGRNKDKGLVEVFVGAGARRHAVLVEFGSGPRQHESGKGTGQVQPQPFMRPAWEAGKQKALDSLARELAVEIERAAARAAKKKAKAGQ